MKFYFIKLHGMDLNLLIGPLRGGVEKEASLE